MPAGGQREPQARQARDVMAFGQEIGRALSDGRIVGRAEPFAKVFPSSRAVKRAVGLVAWGVLEDIALDAQLDQRGRLVAETSVRQIAAHLGLGKNTVNRHLTTLRKYGFVLHEERRDDGSGRYEQSRYVLDPSACIERFTTSPKSAVEPCPRNGDTVAPVSPSTGHRDRGRKEQEAVTPETQQQPAVARLTAAGVSPDVAAQLAERHAAEDVERAVAVAARRAVRNPAGFVVRALREGWDLPSEHQPATASGRTHAVRQNAADRTAAAQAVQERAKAAGWCEAISAAFDDAQLREAVQRVTTPAPGVGRRSLPLARAQLLAWAVQIAHRQPSLPLAEALAAALANGARPVEPINDGIPDPPGITAGAADLTARLRAFLSNPHPPRR